MPAAAVGSGIGLLAPIAANALGIGKNNTRARTFNESDQYDPNAYQYGGHQGGAEQAANQYGGLAADAQQRQAAQAANVGVNYQAANRYQNYGNADRGSQGQAAGLMMQRAQGLVPSIAQQQADRQMQQATAAQSSAAASARGGAGLALAQQNAANNTATMQSSISNQAQINAAQERQQAEQAAFGAYSGMRTGDAQSQQMAAQQSQYAAQIQAQQNQYNAGLMQQQHGMNDAYSANMYGMQNNVRMGQLAASQNQQGMLAGSAQNATNQNVAISQNNANREYDYYQQAIGAAQGGVSGATSAMAGGGGQPSTGLAAPPMTGMSAGGGANSVGVPQPGLSDDRAKLGVTPLGLLFGGSAGGGPGGAVDIGGKGYMSADDITRGSTGLAGQTMPGMVGGGGVTGGNVNLGLTGGGGMGGGGGLLSDDRAKREVYRMGRQDGAERALAMRDDAGDSRAAADQGVRDTPLLSLLAPGLAAMSAGGSLINHGQAMGEDARAVMGPRRSPQFTPLPEGDGSGIAELAKGSGRAAYLGQPGTSAFIPDDRRERDDEMARAVAMQEAASRAHQSDPLTAQFAQGLAPIRFQYRPGMGPGGEQTGVRAQAAASQPVTASMISKRPDGLLAIDPQMGLGTALAGVGHLAQKQQRQDQQLQGLLAMAARREGY